MIETILHKKINEILINLYGDNDYSIQFQSTRKEFEGDITLVVFPFTRFSKLSPEITAKKIPFDQIASHFPIDQPTLTETQRRDIIKIRQRHVQKRFRVF